MIGEIHYWRDMSHILDGINCEIKQSYVEVTLQTLAYSNEQTIKDSVLVFTREKSRVMKGAKEARWNNKYMKVIEKPVQQIEKATELKDIQFVIVSLLKSLKNIYEISNFYKEARIVSFIDRLLDCIMGKIKLRFSLHLSINNGKSKYEEYALNDLQIAKSIITKF